MILSAFRSREPFLELEQMTSIILFLHALKEEAEENLPAWVVTAERVLEGDSKAEYGVLYHGEESG